MKKRIVFLSVCFALATAILAYADDVSGKWTAQVPGRNGQTRETTFNFKVEGDKLTGTVSGMQGDNPISDGKVSGNDITFSVKVSFNGNDRTLLYKGTISGDEIKMMRSMPGSDRPGQEFTAKRAK